VLRSVSLGVDELRHHALVCGATGSGKTSALQLLVDSFLEHLPIVVVDCKASSTLHGHFASIPNAYVWTIGGTLKWDPLRGDATSVSNRLLQGEWYSREADVYRAIAERYLLWVLQTLDMAGVERTPDMVSSIPWGLDSAAVPVKGACGCGSAPRGRLAVTQR
jgi:DNA helicase HerA-like ATPase